jgi:hypothetical protein
MPIQPKPARQISVNLPPARVEQLRAIAEKLNLSIADTIGYMVAKEVAAGVISASIPGVHVSHDGEAVLFGFGASEPIRLTSEETASVIRDIRARAPGSETRQALYAFAEGQIPDAGLRQIIVLRQGNGLTIRIRDEVKSFPPALAGELANLIEAAAV